MKAAQFLNAGERGAPMDWPNKKNLRNPSVFLLI
jgi:hypothetical protein